MLVCIVQQIFKSILIGKFILSKLQRYFRRILHTYFESIWLANLSSRSSRLSSVLNTSLSLLLLLVSSLLGIIASFLPYKRAFFDKCLSMELEYLYISFGVVVGIRDFFVPYFVMLISLSKRIVY